ncbi:MAG: hypothetical protein AAB332_02145 [Planctomycetota bacterium]
MKKTIIVIILLHLLLIFSATSRADSPITATDFYKAYADVKMVKRAHLEGVMGLEIAEFLSSPENPIDVKAAVINAISWKFEGKSNAELYAYYLALLYHLPVSELNTDFLGADETFCLGYLTAIDDYFHPEFAIPLLEEARKSINDSFTVSIISAVVKAQAAFDSDWCEVWREIKAVLENSALKQDLRPEATKIILDYMVLYKEFCD